MSQRPQQIGSARWARTLGAVLLGGLLGNLWGCRPVGEAQARPQLATFDGPDLVRTRLPVGLLPVGLGFDQVTDLQAVPGRPGVLAVLRKSGQAALLTLPPTGAPPAAPTPAFEVAVTTQSEQGLLGLAFHPDYARNHRFFLHYSLDGAGGRRGRIAEWRGPFGPEAQETRVLLEVAQPYANHDGGQIAFGPDGKLYVAFGDGGSAHDPQGHGQNLDSLLGKILRLDVEPAEGGKPYGVPADNPFVGRAGARPEIFAYGLRNPWRFSFTPDGRLVAGDVGQNRFEEITLVPKGANLGWNRREADRCFQQGQRSHAAEDAACQDGAPAAGLLDPLYAYPREDGVSVTGGFVYTGAEVPGLKGQYVFGDFASGRIWAIALPAPGADPGATSARKATALGRFSMQIATFGVGHDGALYVGDFGGGQILRVVTP